MRPDILNIVKTPEFRARWTDVYNNTTFQTVLELLRDSAVPGFSKKATAEEKAGQHDFCAGVGFAVRFFDELASTHQAEEPPDPEDIAPWSHIEPEPDKK